MALAQLAPFRPVRLLEVDVAEPPHGYAVAPGDPADVRCLVRLHTRPEGELRLRVGPEGVTAADLQRAAWDRLGGRLARHLAADGEEVGGRPACLARRESLLADAPSISVVIATRNRPELLGRCLSALVAQAHRRFEVVVVDNAATTPAEDVVAAFARAAGGGGPTTMAVRYVREERPGLARAHNRGVDVASGELLAFLDDDVLADRHWLAAIAACFRDVPGAGCVTGMILPSELETAPQLWLDEHWGINKGFDRRVFERLPGPGDGRLHPYTAGRFGSGANMAFRADVLRRCGGFDAAIGAGTRARGGDDLAAFFDVLASGHQLVYEPAAVVRHRFHPGMRATRAVAYGYGVGLTAYVTRTVWEDPRRLFDIVPRIPAGVSRGLQMRNRATPAPMRCPRHLVALERLGMLCGPVSYLASRRAHGR